jgi:uncharacterized integral membrane protein
MGEKQVFQPLTKEDEITVVLYRAGILLSCIMVAGLALLLNLAPAGSDTGSIARAADLLGYGLFISVGMSVFFIHLYISKFKRFLKYLYYLSLGCLALLLYMGKGSPGGALLTAPYSALLLLPLSGCLGFVAFCFQLLEGYLLALIMPIYLLMVSSGFLAGRGASYGLGLIAVLLVIFTVRKAFMPLAYDIGDKSAYR